MARYYKTDGTVKDVKPQNGKAFEYKELREFVGGMVEIVPLPSGKSIIVNEEGKLMGLPKNEMASMVWQAEYPIEQYPNNNDELIAGNALVASEDELN